MRIRDFIGLWITWDRRVSNLIGGVGEWMESLSLSGGQLKRQPVIVKVVMSHRQ